MNYANANRCNGDRCNHCENVIAKHKINIIRSDDETTALARQLQAQLDKSYVKALENGYPFPGIDNGSPNSVIMTGAITATVGSRKIQAVALSGYNAERFISIMDKPFGKNVEVLGQNVDPSVFQSILGISISKEVNQLRRLQIPYPAYPVGSCAGQKLLNYVVQYAIGQDQRIAKIRMAEIFWKTGGTSDWSTGDLVPSCNTCNYILPMILCNYDAMNDEFPYPYTPDLG